MKIEQQVCTRDQAKRLKLLGVNQESYFHYGDQLENVAESWMHEGNEDTFYSAFTVAELGVMLPPSDISKGEFTNFSKGANGLSWSVDCSIWDAPGFPKDGKPGPVHHYTEAECRAEILITLLEKKLITVDEVNQRLQDA